jgi:flagellar protein FlbT
MPLHLKLKPNERVIIGGAVVRNGNSRVEIQIDNEVPVLRESDILSPAAVRTPCERIYLALQLLYVDTEQVHKHLETLKSLVDDVLEAAPSCTHLIEPIERHLREGKFYQALKSARALLEHERKLIANVH